MAVNTICFWLCPLSLAACLQAREKTSRHHGMIRFGKVTGQVKYPGCPSSGDLLNIPLVLKRSFAHMRGPRQTAGRMLQQWPFYLFR